MRPSREEKSYAESSGSQGISVGNFYQVHGSSQREAIRTSALFSVCALEN